MSNKYENNYKSKNRTDLHENSRLLIDQSIKLNLTSPLDFDNKTNISRINIDNNNTESNHASRTNIKEISNKLNFNYYNQKNYQDKNNSFKSDEIKKVIKIMNYDSKIKQRLEDSNYPNESLGLYLKNNVSQKENKTNELIFEDDKGRYTHAHKIEDDNLIINNLEKELKEKNDEIKLLKKNFKEKIELIEKENLKIVNNLEDQYDNVVKNINVNFVENVNGLEVNSLRIKNEYEDILSKIQSNIVNLKNNTVDLRKHESIIQDLKTKSFLKVEEFKNNYEEKLRELINYFDKPDYRKYIQNINFYLKFKEKIDFTPEDLNIIENINFTDQEYEIWIDRIKLNMVSAECNYINGVIDLENDYLSLYEQIKMNETDKFKYLENEINEKFERLEKLSYFDRDERLEINQFNENLDHKNNSYIYTKSNNNEVRIENDNAVKIQSHNNDNYINNNVKKIRNPSKNKQTEFEREYENFYKLDYNENSDRNLETEGKPFKINNYIPKSRNLETIELFKINETNSNNNNIDSNKKSTERNGSENETKLEEFKGKSVNDKIKDYLNSNLVNIERMSNIDINNDTRENINSNSKNLNNSNLMTSNKNNELYIVDELDGMDFEEDVIVNKKINHLSNVNILTNHK